jgi:uncharacterized protein
MPDHLSQAGRRRFLRGAAIGGAGLALSPLGRLFAQAGEAAATPQRLVAGYGRLRAVRDDNTGLPLLMLPEGFRYTTFGWAGQPLDDGTPCPAAHDGMGIVRSAGDRLTLVRNHEQVGLAGAFGPAASRYDPACTGGTVTLDYDLAAGRLVAARASLSGTLQNCAGGVTPWNSWLSCEEFVADAAPDALVKDQRGALVRDHGFVFEVPADGLSAAVALRDMGQFRHEAAVVHAPSGDVFLTEDAEPSAGFYRFVPTTPGKLAEGGRLYMLKAVGTPDLRSGLRVGQRWAVEWVLIERPDDGYVAATRSIQGVHDQGVRAGASRFTRLEGCIANDEEVFFTATNGGDTANGQVFCYYPKRAELALIYESSDGEVLDYPDNICLSPRGGMVICQDAKRERQHLYGLTRGGELFAFARNNVVLDGALGFSGDFRRAEWAGSCFSPDGRTLFANVYAPGFTVAITGPWKEGLI